MADTGREKANQDAPMGHTEEHMNYSFTHMLGTKDDGTLTARLELNREGTGLWATFTGNEDIQAFVKAVTEGRDYLQDIAQQTHLHCTPSSAPTVFANLAEEQDEIASFNSSNSGRFPL